MRVEACACYACRLTSTVPCSVEIFDRLAVPTERDGGSPLLLTLEEFFDVLAAELGTFHDGMADALEHFLEPGADLTLADLLDAPLDPFGRLVHLGLVGGADRPAGESQGRKESGSDPHPAKSPCHHIPPSVRLAHRSRDHQLGPVARCDPMPATSS